MPRKKPRDEPERVQTGLRIEPRLLKVMKALAEYLELSVAELVELVMLQAFEREPGFSAGTLQRIQQLKHIYDMDYGLADVRARLYRARGGSSA